MDNYEVSVEDDSYSVEIDDQPVTTLFTRAKKLNVQNGTNQVSWTFATTLSGNVTDYIPTASIQNTVDSFPMDLIPRISFFSLNTIVVTLNAPVETGNYYINVTITPAWDP